jgi:hypothetical protein
MVTKGFLLYRFLQEDNDDFILLTIYYWLFTVFCYFSIQLPEILLRS